VSNSEWQRDQAEGAKAMREKRERDAAELHALREVAERARYLIEDIEAVVAEADRPKGGMQAPFLHDLSAQTRQPSFVSWARRAARSIRSALARLEEVARG
jgi:hypothetical protein